MASTCPRCHRILEEDEVCCAEIQLTWRCSSCFRVGGGSAIPYGKCFMCGGTLEIVPHREKDEGVRQYAIRDAVELQLNLFHFYKRALERTTSPEQQQVFDSLCETALDHLHDLEDRYRVHIENEMLDVASRQEKLSRHWALQGIRLDEASAVEDVLEQALEIERRVREHFRQLESEFPAGIGYEECRELEAEADEDISMIETEIQQLT